MDVKPSVKWLNQRAPVLSITAHVFVLACLLAGFHWGPKIAPYRFPGTAQGVRTLTYFSPGNPRPKADNPPLAKPVQKVEKSIQPPDRVAAAEPANAAAPANDPGAGEAAKSGVGEGNISIALPRVFPYPTADVSGLARGAGGDVILNAVIDEHGRITELTLIRGLGSPIDQTVLATVQGWSYAPATKDGVPVRSEQELRFHYERRG